MSLLQLPSEIILIIAQYLSTQHDIYSLMQINRQLYHLLQHILYRYNVKYGKCSAMLWAAKKGNLGVMKKLLAEGAATNKIGFKIKESRDLWSLSNLYSRFSPLGSAQNLEDSPLLFAVRENHEDMVEFLLCELAKDCETPVMLMLQVNETLATAAVHGYNEIVLRMLSWGADINFKITRGIKTWTPPLTLAASNGHVETVMLLLKHGADIRGGSRQDSALYAAVRGNQTSVARLLLEKGADPNSIYADLLSPAAERGDAEMVDVLLSMGPQFQRSLHCRRALFKAIEGRHEQVTRLLIEKGGADPKLSDDVSGRSTMRTAIRHDQPNLGLVKLLLEKGVLPDSQDLRLVRFHGNEELLQLLEEHSDPRQENT
ncbi:ankyrin repeat-containing domain protein [Talaromyces proteolyticus]|uniref:Ankyrin repeat-containing domain protein n=1 Tax=Talaromyces proteolyticus TaxID=1131652 RepID=A0AAD4L3F3_9EURO|nr:ankyrin repeat-containing domain protein [Talaromyces proteolyticus]KAH8705885.1 ankyrin repeat-containing domain protein [Talaromyces proteolyticus]